MGEGWRGQPSVRLLLTHGNGGEKVAALVSSCRQAVPVYSTFFLSGVMYSSSERGASRGDDYATQA